MAHPEEVLLCDTSYVSLHDAGRRKPERIAHWPAEIVDRLNGSTRAISVVTVAEQRAGWLNANWGEPTIDKALARLRAYLWVPI